MALVGNKHDLLAHHMTEEEFRKEARPSQNRFSGAAALTGERVDTVFEHIVAL
jgi:hypothetical protein